MNGSVSRRRFLAASGAACATAAAGTAVSTGAAGPAPESASVGSRQADPDEVEAVLDDLVGGSLDEHDVPGATVAVVVDGDVALAKGYGVADRQSGDPVDPAETPFRVGSVSKAVLWTAIMRRVRRGDLDPEADVTRYVEDVAIPDTYDEPITLAHLATHRAGFEESNRGLWISNRDDLRSLPSYLRSARPARVRPPGEAGSYSNYGAALAGGVLAAARDEPFADAVENELLDPAGMADSSFRQPLPASLAERHATGHGPLGAYRDGQFPLVGLRPAGSLSATADDMARFLQVHLNDGRVDGEAVLDPGTVDALHRQWATHHEGLQGMAFGLVEEAHGDVRTLRHNGSTIAFHSDLVLVPEHGLGLFVSFNGTGGAAARGDVVDGFLEELLPEPDRRPRSPDGPPERADDLAGTYRSLRVSRTGHDRITTTAQAPTVGVNVADDGALVTEIGGSRDRWVEVEPLLFEHVEGGRRLAFGEAGGGVEYLYLGSSPTAFGRVETVDRLALHAALAAVTVLGLLSAVVGWPAAAVLRAVRADDPTRLRPDLRRWREHVPTLARAVAAGSALPLLVFPVLAGGHFLVAPFAVLSAPPLTFAAVFALPVAGLVGTVATLGAAALSWRRGYWSVPGRVHYAAVAASLAGACWLLWYWNLLVPPG